MEMLWVGTTWNKLLAQFLVISCRTKNPKIKYESETQPQIRQRKRIIHKT